MTVLTSLELQETPLACTVVNNLLEDLRAISKLAQQKQDLGLKQIASGLAKWPTQRLRTCQVANSVPQDLPSGQLSASGLAKWPAQRLRTCQVASSAPQDLPSGQLSASGLAKWPAHRLRTCQVASSSPQDLPSGQLSASGLAK